MKLAKQSETKKVIQQWTTRLIWIVIIAVILIGGGLYLQSKGIVHFVVSEDLKDGSFGWFFRMVDQMGWIKAIISVAFILVCAFVWLHHSERKNSRQEKFEDLDI